MAQTNYSISRSTTEGTVLKRTPVKRNYIVWFGSPGIYDPEDKKHDQAWYSYINPMLRLAEAGKLGIKQSDTMYWCVYAPGYKMRWEADIESKLLFIQDLVAKVKKYGSLNYLDHIKRRAAEFSAKWHVSIKVKELAEAKMYWDDLKAYPDGSVVSVWYFGHGRNDLWLELHHDPNHVPVLKVKPGINFITCKEIQKNGALCKKKFVSKSIPSKFYGCNTTQFAAQWFLSMGVRAEGASGTMDFSSCEGSADAILACLENNVKPDGIGSGQWERF